MPVKSRINGRWLKETAYFPLRISFPKLNEQAGLAKNYLYQLCDSDIPRNPTIDTIDKIVNALEARFLELNISPPDNLWQMLVIQERQRDR